MQSIPTQHDGLRSAMLVLDGVVADVNLAVEMRSGKAPWSTNSSASRS
ncbi:MAG: hypothetical protein HY043_15565 [Verrucomicrobia bacterium]|nr:hypothetical protein [Verrucomicrobiota bacterium]